MAVVSVCAKLYKGFASILKRVKSHHFWIILTEKLFLLVLHCELNLIKSLKITSKHDF